MERCFNVADDPRLAMLPPCALAAMSVDRALPPLGCEPISIGREVESAMEYHAYTALRCAYVRQMDDLINAV